mmetsp:Transcript_79530/g.224918  ORF Transcript_79530/g.224918 Transcript_79530/m.224918 type:complete len:108 (+) Transcript_79530:17-340(+)
MCRYAVFGCYLEGGTYLFQSARQGNLRPKNSCYSADYPQEKDAATPAAHVLMLRCCRHTEASLGEGGTRENAPRLKPLCNDHAAKLGKQHLEPSPDPSRSFNLVPPP